MTTLKYPYNKLNPVFTCSYVAIYRDINTDKNERVTRYVNIRAFDRAEAKRICKLLTGALVKTIKVESMDGYSTAAENDKPDIKKWLYKGV